MRRPLLLLPRPLDQFVLGDHARELIESAEGVGALPGAVPYGALLRSPASLRGGVASSIARSLARSIPADWSADDTVLVAYHAVQWPAAEALLRRGVASELWYCRWDRYEAAQDAGKASELLGEWHTAMAEASSLTFAVSGRLAELEREAGREAIVVGLSADAFPDGPLEPGGHGAELLGLAVQGADAPIPEAVLTTQPQGAGGGESTEAAPTAGPGDAGGTGATQAPIAVSLGHLGYRTDWAMLRGVIERMADLQVLLIGAWHEDEVGEDPDYRWLRANPQAIWLGALDDADAADVIAQADAGLIPFTVDPFNDAGLPTRILKYARLGRPTVSPRLAGAATWDRAVIFGDRIEDHVHALRELAGARHRPDTELRAWALEQTAAKMNAPLHERLRG